MSDDDLPKRARAARKLLKLTQEQVAEMVGLSLRAYQGFEAGETKPQPANMARIVEVLSLGLDEEGSAAVADWTRFSWPSDVQVFLDVMGQYLTTMPESERIEKIHSLTRQIFMARLAQ